MKKQHHSSLPPHNPHTRTPIYTLTYGYSSTTGLSWLERCTGIAGLIPTRGPTIFAKNYGTGAVIDNLKEITPPIPTVQCWAAKNVMSGCNRVPTRLSMPTLINGWGREGEKTYHEMVY